jgi:hypothetical protein
MIPSAARATVVRALGGSIYHPPGHVPTGDATEHRKEPTMFERRSEPLLPFDRFLGRLMWSLVIAAVIDALALVIGAIGFRSLEGLPWADAYLNAALVVTGNGPIAHMGSTSGKVFLLVYALAGVVVFGAVIACVAAPLLHRVLHAFHLDVSD